MPGLKLTLVRRTRKVAIIMTLMLPLVMITITYL